MRIRSLLLTTSLLLTGCGSDDSVATTAATTVAPGPTTAGTVTVFVEGVRWELPASVCAESAGDSAAVAEAALNAAEEVMELVADRASGWPTTTAAPPGEAASFFVAVNRAGPTALALATLQDIDQEVVTSWEEFEASYAELDGSPGPVTDISDRLEGWRITANEIAAAVPGACG